MPYDTARGTDPVVVSVLVGEREQQNNTPTMTVSEDHTSEAVMEAQSSELMNDYVEGYPGSRYYGGYEYADEVKQLVIDRAKRFQDAGHVSTQPHSGSQANMGVSLAVLDPGGKILSLDLIHGGHLSYGHPVSVVGEAYEVEQYEVNAKTGYVDYDQLAAKAGAFDPDTITLGYFAYPRKVEWERVQVAADSVDAYHLADAAHIMGLVTTGKHSSLVGTADFVTGLTHKTIRSGRGGIITYDEEHADDVDPTVFPGLRGGPILYDVAGKVVGFGEALTFEFEGYTSQVVDDAAALGRRLQKHGLELVPEGTDTHLVLVDPRPSHPGTTGKDMEATLEEVDIVLNVNTVPGESRLTFNPSGIHAGTPVSTTRGLDEGARRTVADLIYEIVGVPHDESVGGFVDRRVNELTAEYPPYD